MSTDLAQAPPGARQVTPLPAPGPPEEKAPGCPNLTAALAQARDRCKAAAKDGHNAFHGYKYATADEVVAVATEAMNGSGLALLPARQAMGTLGSGAHTIFTLDRTVLLSHASGEFMPLVVEGWPVIPDKGRPLDKAFAIALTSSLAYLLRDLLQMPRGTDQDTSARDDRQAQPTPAPQQPQADGEPQEPDHRAAALATAAAARLERYGTGRAGAPGEPRPDHAQIDRIGALVERRKLPWLKFAARLKQKYGVESLAHLAPGQADEVERALLAPRST